MQVLFLTPLLTLILDILAWVVFNMGVSYLCSRIPDHWLDPGGRFFHAFGWEKEGQLYEQLFHVRTWKQHIPNGGKSFDKNLSLESLPSRDPANLLRWLKESIRAEICHWLLILPGFLFFLWNPRFAGWVMVLFAFLFNIGPVVLQRFNRPRMRKLIITTSDRNLRR
jgi:glycosyl-4,4'-diaponeurosporenoate acyltransferase